MRAPQVLILGLALAAVVAASAASPFAMEVVRASGPFGPTPYHDPNAVLGAPATWFYDRFGEFSGGTTNRRVKLIEPAYNIAPTNTGLITSNLILTLGEGSEIIVRFEQPIADDPTHPYGVDFLVFGNTFYTANGAVNDQADANTLELGGAFSEPVKVSVSPGFTGQSGEVTDNPDTWPWYRYENGPYGDSTFPTQAFKWNRATTNWSNELMDFTKPVNPAMQAAILADGVTAADAIDLYVGSGGGTGFDLRESGFATIRYVKVQGIGFDFSDGEIDAFSAVRTMVIGDALAITPENVLSNTATLFVQQPDATSNNVVTLSFTSLNGIAQVNTAPLTNLAAFASLPGVARTAVELSLVSILGDGLIHFSADLGLTASADYGGDGGDLIVLRSEGSNWVALPFAYQPTNHQVQVVGLTNLSAFAVVQFAAPAMQLNLANANPKIGFAPIPGLRHTVERSTNLIHWDALDFFTASNSLPAVVEDNTAPAAQAFYRLRVQQP